ncbi:MAG TPA: ADOP family duplicated permease [Bryobacteraceae bacterium]|nr:ADOP family duplicated permease [Bryobacteraceae bacterium]
MFWSLRQAARGLWRDRSFTLTAALTLALGIGATTAVFSVVDAVLLRPLPYADQDRLLMLWTDDPKHNVHEEGTSLPNFLDWKSRNGVFEDLAACSRDIRFHIERNGEIESAVVSIVTPNLFSILGVQPTTGRAFTAEEDVRGDRVAVISQALAARRFGADSPLGQSLRIDNRDYQVVGVMPASFAFPVKEAQAWVPLMSTRFGTRVRENRWADVYRVVGRLKPGVTLERARTDMARVSAAMAAVYPIEDPDFAGFGVNLVPILEQSTGSTLPNLLWLLAGAVGFVLLIAAANLANLLLVRAEQRRKEFSIRLSLGATHGSLLKLTLAESALLLAFSLGLGYILADSLVAMAVAFGPTSIPRLNEAALRANVLATAFSAAALACLFANLIPYWLLRRQARGFGVRVESRAVTASQSTRRMQGALIVAQLSLSLILLGGAGLFLKSFWNSLSADLGMRRENILLAEVERPRDSNSSVVLSELLGRLRALPGVVAAGGISDFFIVRNPDYGMIPEGKPPVPSAPLTADEVTPGYFAATGARLLRGRLLDEHDFTGNQRNVVVTESVASRYWAGEDAIGKRFRHNPTDSPKTVVGIVADMRRSGIESRPPGQIFQAGYPGSSTIAIRTAGHIDGLVTSVRREIRNAHFVMPSEPRMIEQDLSTWMAPRRFHGLVLASFAALAVLLAALGVYGVVQYSVLQRQREIGVRVAVGATPALIRALILGQGLRYAAAGLALGIAGFLALGRVLQSLLFDVKPADPLAILAAAASLLLATLVACWRPAARALSISPVDVLRSE